MSIKRLYFIDWIKPLHWSIFRRAQLCAADETCLTLRWTRVIGPHLEASNILLHFHRVYIEKPDETSPSRPCFSRLRRENVSHLQPRESEINTAYIGSPGRLSKKPRFNTCRCDRMPLDQKSGKLARKNRIKRLDDFRSVNKKHDIHVRLQSWFVSSSKEAERPVLKKVGVGPPERSRVASVRCDPCQGCTGEEGAEGWLKAR